jgi:hypothetical protein
MRRLPQAGILTWFALTLCAGIAVSWIAISTFHAISRDQAVAALEDLRAAERIAAIARFLDHASPVLRPQLAEAISGSSLVISAAGASAASLERPPDRRAERLLEVLSARLAGVRREGCVDTRGPRWPAAEFWLPASGRLTSRSAERLLLLQDRGPGFVCHQLMDGSAELRLRLGRTLPFSTCPMMGGLIGILTELALGVIMTQFLPPDGASPVLPTSGRGGGADVRRPGSSVRRGSRNMRRAIRRDRGPHADGGGDFARPQDADHAAAPARRVRR